MNHFETEIAELKSDFTSLWEMVALQLRNALRALANNDRTLSQAILEEENRVNALEVKIERNCENIIALYNPVAIDLRFILAMIKMNSNLERAGDIATRVAKFVLKADDAFFNDLINKTHALSMFEESCELMDDALEAFKTNDAQKARAIFKRDEYINDLNKTALNSVIDSIKSNPQEIEKYLKMMSLLRRIEKSGDISKSIAEEIIFFLEAKVLRHKQYKNEQ